MPGEIHRIIELLGVPIGDANWSSTREHWSFDYMKANAAESVSLGCAFWDGGAQIFVHKGRNGRWRDVLSRALSQAYESKATDMLPADSVKWLANGS